MDLVGGVDSRDSYVSEILYVKTKESGPLGGVRRARPLDPPMLQMISLVIYDFLGFKSTSYCRSSKNRE